MDTKPASGNVIDLRSRGNTLPYPDLFAEVRALAVRRFPAILSEVLDQADDALFDFVQRSSSSVEQQEYFDAMRELRRQRSAVEQRYRDHFQEVFAALEKQRPLEAQSGGDDGGGLSLVGAEELEEQLACEQTASAIERRHIDAQAQLDRRMAVIAGLEELSTKCNPIGPMHLCAAFRFALDASSDLQIQARLVLYKLFEREALTVHGNVLHEANQRLHQAGIAAELKPVAPTQRAPREKVSAPRLRPAQPSAAPAAPSSVSQRRAGVTSGSLEAAPEPIDDLFVAVQEIFAAYLSAQRQTTPREAAGAVARPVLGARGALTALSMLQRNVPDSVMRAVDNPQLSLGNLLKHELMGHATSMGLAPPNSQMADQDEQALFLVGMLFDVLLGQRSYEREVREQFVRLSVPYAKAAMLDQRLFAQKSHPARRLLNALAEACDGNHGESNGERELLSRVTGVVDRLNAEFNEDVAIFTTIEEEFRGFLEQHQRRIELAERRATEAQRGRERLEEARISAAMELALLMGAREAPPALENFLSRYWTHHLAVVMLRDGTDSPRYAEARAAGELMWTTFLDCENGAEPPAELHGKLEAVLASSGVTGEAARDVLEAVDSVLQSLRLGQRQAALDHSLPAFEGFAPPSASEASPGAAPGAAADGTPGLEVVGGTDSLEFDPADVERIRAMQVGAWVEFIEADGTSQPAKLSWVSPISSRLLFVNRRGLRLCASSAEELAALLKQGRFVLREGDSAIERAMSQVLGKLREQVPGNSAG
jgi:hypothetical protein